MINKTDAENVAEMIIEYVDHINRTYPGYTGSYNYTGSQYIFNIDGDSIIELNHINIACSGKFEVITGKPQDKASYMVKPNPSNLVG